MGILVLILISIGLAMDCFAVSFSASTLQPDLKFKHSLLIGFSFGFFQAAFAFLGWLGGATIAEAISAIDHWIVFSILLVIGLKMIYEAFNNNEESKDRNIIHLPNLLLLSVATSIDALATGFSFSLSEVNIAIACNIIGIFSLLFSIIGVYGGKKLSKFIKPKYAELIGGIILILIGSKILVEHLIH
ncbi:MAG: manganese efflux pump MntP family protein [Bacteroidales bacterium]|jgi:putative Mn2+ efflux pump MntP|nr:manganese efflux pump MntP family protein [Bacteroidales bacterium]